MTMPFGKKKDVEKEVGSEESVPNFGSFSPSTATTGGTNTAGTVDAFLGRGTKIVGNLSFSGPVEIEGSVEGEIRAEGRLTIGEAAVIKGKVFGVEVLVKGAVTGDITATKKLSLKRPAKVHGNLSCKVLSIDEGVEFEGKSTMVGFGSALVSEQTTEVSSSTKMDFSKKN